MLAEIRGSRLSHMENYTQGRGLLSAQKHYYAEWVHLRDHYLCKRVRPWTCMALMPHNSRAFEWANGYRPQSLGNRFVRIEDLDVLVMFNQPKHIHGKMRINTELLLGGFTNQAGSVTAGTSNLRNYWDLSMAPYQQSQLFSPAELKPNIGYTATADGRFQLRDNGLWVDVCLRRVVNSNKMLAFWRFHKDDVAEGKVKFLVNPKKLVRADTPIFEVTTNIVAGQARFDPQPMWYNSKPNRMQISKEREQYTYIDNCLVAANAMLEQCREISADDSDMPVFEMHEWAPVPLLEIPVPEFKLLWFNEKFRKTDFLYNMALQAVSPEGDLTVRADFSGTVTKIVPSRSSGMLLLHIGDNVQSIPKCMPVKPEVGQYLNHGEVIGDIVPRDYYHGWKKLAQLIDTAPGPKQSSISENWFLKRVLEHSVIGKRAGWGGSGWLVDQRALPGEIISKHWKVWLDCRKWLDLLVNDKFIVCPPIYNPDHHTNITCNGITYDWSVAANEKHKSKANSPQLALA